MMQRLFGLLLGAVLALCSPGAFAGLIDQLPVFSPIAGANQHAQLATVVLAATTSAQNVTLPVGDGSNNQVEIYNGTTGILQCNFGDGANTTAVTTGSGYPIAAGQKRVLTLLPYMTAASCLSSVAGNVYFTRGNGAS